MQKILVMSEKNTQMCHSSTVLPLDDKNVLVSWFGGSREGEPDVAIWISRFDGEKFNKPQKIACGSQSHWNPVLFRLDANQIMLFYKVGQNISTWRTFCKISNDNGNTFGKEFLFDDENSYGRGPVRNKPIKLEDGTILCGGSCEDKIWSSFCDRTEDNFKTLTKSQDIVIENLQYNGENTAKNSKIPLSEQSFYGRGVIQPTMFAKNNNVVMLLRSSEGNIYKSESNDGGKTFTSAKKTNIPNNNSGIDCVRVLDKIFLVYNPINVNFGDRTPLSIAISSDFGENFEKILDLEVQSGEYSYPAVVTDNKYLYITYTYNRENIAFCKILINDILGGKNGK